MKKNQGILSKQKFVPFITAEGIQASINPKDIPESMWDHHHGKTATGVKVNSLQSVTFGDSLLIRKNTGGPTLSVSTAEFEVAAVQILTGMGYKMQAPTGQ